MKKYFVSFCESTHVVLKSLVIVFVMSVLCISKAQSIEKTVTVDNFTSTVGDMDSYVSYSTAIEQSSTNPRVLNGNIRLYKKSGTSKDGNGNSITITSQPNVSILSVSYTINMDYSCNYLYSLDGQDKTAAKVTKNPILIKTNGATSVLLQNANADKYLEIISLTVVYDLHNGKTDTSLSWSNTVFTAKLGEENSFPTLQTTPSILVGVIYKSSDESVATINVDGEITLIASGTTEITAQYPEDETYNSSSAKYVLTVLSKDNPVIFYESFDGCNGKGGNDGVWSGISTTVNAVCDVDGWTLSSDVKGMCQCVKSGTSSSGGVAKTPQLSFEGDAVLLFSAGAWKGDAGKLKLSMNNGTIFSTSSGASSVSLELQQSNWTRYFFPIHSSSLSSTISFDGGKTSNNRFFLDEVKIARGHIRNLSGSYGTVCLPYSVAAGDYKGAKFYELKGFPSLTETDVLLFEEVESLEAGVPYLYVADERRLILAYSGTAVKEATSLNGMYGSLEKYAFADDVAYREYDYLIVKSDGVLRAASAKSGVNANCAFIKLSEVPVCGEQLAKERTIAISLDDDTAIRDVDFCGSEAELCIKVDGRVSKLKRGINILRSCDGRVVKKITTK